MPQVILITKGTGGDLFPYLQFGKALAGRGHAVKVLTHWHFEDAVRKSGLDFAALDTPELFNPEAGENLLAYLPRDLKVPPKHLDLSKALAEADVIGSHCGRRDTVLIVNHIAYAPCKLVAEKLRLPVIAVYLSPAFVENLTFFEELYRFRSDDINRAREQYGLPPVQDWRSWWASADAYIGTWPEWYASVGEDCPFTINGVGFLQDESVEMGELPAEVKELLDGGAPPVLITHGTSLPYRSKFFSASAEACRLVGRRGILVTPHEGEVPNPMPEGVRRFKRLPFGSLMPHVGAAIHHGGIGTTAQALAAGVPQLVLGFGFDRPFNGACVERLGVGEYLPPVRWRAEDIAESLDRALKSGQVREKCKALAESMEGPDAAAAACDVIERLFAARAPEQESPGLLAPDKRALLALRLKKRRQQESERQRIRRRGDTNPAPLSFAQQRLWLLNEMNPDSPLYNISTAVRLKGRLNVGALEQTMREVVRRHEVLRTSFRMMNGHAVQVVNPLTDFELPVTDLSHLSEEGRESDAQWQASQGAQAPFDLSQAPLLRARLLRLAADEHVLLFTMHHIVCDGWSIGILVREVAALYAAYSQGEPSPLGELPVQYADYAVWQREWLSAEVLERQLQYWTQQLTGGDPTRGLPVLELPTDRPRPAAQSFRGAVKSFELPAELSAGLKRLSRAEGVTLYMTLLAAFQTLLHRYSGAGEVLVGTPSAGRGRAEVESLIGFFVNTLVMRGDLSGGPSFRELLARTREAALGAYAHQELPFEKLVEELAPERGAEQASLFRVWFSLNNAQMSELEMEGLGINFVAIDNETSKFDLSLSLWEPVEGLAGSVTYSTDIFDESTIERMLEHFRRLLEAVIATPGAKVADLPLLSDDERRLALVEWNRTEAEFPSDLCVHQLFERQAVLRPEAVALTFEDQQLTYAELNERANQLAHYLRKAGVGPETLVGLSTERSVEMVVGVLGILKAGGAYLPLNPSYPKERLAFILEDAQAPLLLTRDSLLENLPEHDGRVLSLDSLGESLARESAENLEGGAAPEGLAYVIYTSGSTGRPKGVAVGHRGLCNLAAAQASEFGISRGSRVLQFASFSFDASVSEVFTALVSGATLCVERESKVLSGDDLVNVLREREINVVTLPPAVLAVTEAEGLPALETVVSAGESCPAEVAQRWSYGRRFINAYGPTEATVCATMRLCDGLEEEVVPIGLPMANVRVYVLDASLQPVPAGVIGELYIGGGGLARGYLRRPGATAERFIPNPFAAEPGERLYRTGDLARQRQDGQLVFAGRADQQVKVRGYRIEPGEVEAALLQHEAVSEALVVADGAREGDKRLVAYLVPREESAADRAALVREAQQHAKERLPEYMVPSIFMVLDELPLTPHGKVDRRRLPAPEVTRTDEVTGTNAPRTPVEEMLCGVAADVLGVEEVGINDNFFQAGGHSLMATQLISRVREIFQVNLSLRSFFEAPTVVGLAEVIEAEIRAGQGVQSPPIEPVAREEGLPLSFAQQRLWFLDQLEPGGSAYNVPSAVRLEGPLDLGALERTVGEIVRRHETLRTSFPTAEGRPQQRIAPVSEIRLAVTDLSPLPAAEREAAARRLAREEAERPFDLATGPLFRVGALRLGEEEHVVLFTMHHIVCDGWSLGVMVREIVALYGAYSRGAAPALPEPPIQYVDFAVWQRNWLRGDVLEAQLDFWKKQLGAGELPALKLPTDRPRPATRSFVGAQEQFTLPFAFLEKVKALSRQEGVTMFMTLLGAFQALLHRYSGQDEILVGSSIANRNRAEIEGLIGFFVNTLVMRGDFGGNPTFKELLGRVRDAALGAYAHQDLPFEKLVEEMQPERSLGGAPLFQVAFNLQNAPWENLELQGLRLSYLGVSSETSKFDLALYMSESHEGLHGKFEYATDIFEAETIRRLVGHFRRLLEAAVADPEQRVSTLPLLTEEELRQALAGPAREEFDREFCIHELFERRAAAAPESVALTFEDRHVTYAELNERAERLARRLRGCGVGPEAPVALCLERSPELVVAMLAALKAGGAYVPLDPQYPAERLAFILEDTGAPVVLTEEGLLGRLPETAARLICLGGASADEPAAEGVPAGPARKALPDNTAYIIYTSGSTGRPKGVAVSHHNLARLLSAANPLFDFGPEDVWTLFHSYAFDFSVWEIWGALLTGGRLVVTPYLVSRSPADFRRLLCEQRVTVLNQTPSAFRQLVTVDQEATGGDHLSLRLVIFGGEALEFASLRPWFDCHGDERPRLVNMYGITETTVHVTYRPLGGADAERQAGSLIGDPLADLELYVLDRHLQPVPVGVPGELYVGGAGLARGYLNRPALTAERFIPNPFSQEPGARLYRSGDVARRRADGELEYIGRGDEQVKVRGFRIELGEIEAALRQYAGVKDVLVLVNDEVEGDERLVAYVVADADARPAPSELRRHLKELLPSYMVPAAYVLLEQFPLTPNGKLDRRALPSPFVNGAAQGEPARATAGPVEEVVCGIAADVLGVERLCGEDNFFDAGGHSLLATQFILRLREALQVEVALRSVFERPRLAELAGLVEAELKAGRGAQAPPLGRAERGGGLPASFAQQRLWFLDQLEGGSHAAYNMPGAFRLRGALDLEALGRTLSEVVRRHEVLRTSFATAADGTPVQVIHAPQPFAVPLLDLSGLPAGAREAEVRRLIAEEAQEPFDLTEAPLLRARLLRLSAEEHVALFTMHHIVCDGWSMGVLVKEVSALYNAFSEGESSPLEELRVQYADYAVWQRRWLSGEVLEQQLNYWRGQLTGGDAGGELSVLELPTDHPRPAVQSFRGAMLGFELPDELSAALKRLSRREGVTLYMTLLAAFQALLSRYSGQEQVLVGTTVANRSHPEVENLIGFFVNTLVMRGDLSGDPSFRELLSRVREAALGAYAHQDVPFELLVERLQPERDLGRAPLFQVVFTMQNAEREELSLGGVEVSGLGGGGETAKYDLVLNMWEAGGGLRGGMEYNSDLFEPATAARIVSHLQSLLRAAAADADAPVSGLSLFSEGEGRALLDDFNDTAADYPRETCIHELFERQAGLTPAAAALRCGAHTLTYAELNGRANRLARLLRSQGVGPWSPVAVLLEHSAELVVSLLAVLKAGGHYLPLDPAHPPARLATILGDARPALVITETALTTLLPEGIAPVLLVEECGEAALSGFEAENLPAAAGGAEAPAYVIYTSGSTGTPKGVAVSHRSLVNYVCWAADSYLRAEERFADGAAAYENLGFALYSSVAFDLTVTSVYVPLLTGNRVEVYARRGPALSLLDVAADDRCEVLKLTPSHLSLLVEQAQGGTRLRRLVVGGEALPAGLARRARERFGEGLEVYNEYGPTEATVGCMLHRFGEGGAGREWVPVGRPAANTQIYVLDRHLQPVPAGVSGEIYIGGDCLAEGYLNRPGLTADRFLPDPFSRREGARLYRTGDVARHLACGAVECLGRRDEQVKVRGHLVELGELRAAVNRHPQVRDSVVVLREDKQGRRLVCYYVARQEVEEAELREYVARSVIAETAPSAYVRLGRMPLTVNGKVNTEALPEPPERRAAAVEVTAGADSGTRPVEELVCGVAAEVLGVERLSGADNFFDAGGHSLLATRLVMRLREALGVEVPLRGVFERPRLGALAELVSEGLKAGHGAQAPPLGRAERGGGGLPVSFAQRRLWFLDQLEGGGSAAYNIPIALRLLGPLDLDALERTLTEVVRRHETLRTTFKLVDGEPRQLVSYPSPVRLAFTDLSKLERVKRERQAQSLVAEEAREPFDLAQGPLLRARLLRLSANEHVALFTMHHIVCDGWSMGVLVKEVSALYEALRQGEASPLSELPVQYADYAVWQRSWLTGEVLERQLDYWAEQLTGGDSADLLPVLELPTDHPRPAVQSFRGAVERFELPDELSRELKRLSRREGVTLYMTLLAAFQTLLHRYSGQEQVLVGTPNANRSHPEVENLIGFFVNTLVMRGDLSGDPTFEELLGRTREAALGAYAHQDVPFELLVERLAPERDLSRAPVFQVVFTMQNAEREELSLGGVEVSGLGGGGETAKYDLVLNMWEAGGGLRGGMEYNSDLFEPGTVRRLLSHFESLLRSAVERPETRVRSLQMLSREEQALLNEEINLEELDESFAF